jgi:hypothetical protein
MVFPNGSGTLLLERPLDAPERSEQSLSCPAVLDPVDVLALEVVGVSGDGIGSLLRAPGLVALAATFLIEGYRWLGVIHVGTTQFGSVFFGTVGLGAVALAAPWVALFLTSNRRTGANAIADLVTVVAVAAVVATGTALVVGGPVWRVVAGTTDLVLAATALTAVILGERARRRADAAALIEPSGGV